MIKETGEYLFKRLYSLSLHLILAMWLGSTNLRVALLLLILDGCTARIPPVYSQGLPPEQTQCEANLPATGKPLILPREQGNRYEEEIIRLRYNPERTRKEKSASGREQENQQ